MLAAAVLTTETPMAPEDRDPIFEKALARYLRAKPSSPAASREAEAEAAVNTQASAGAPGAGIVPGSSSHDPACPDPEVLAAYHERLLVPEEMASLKEHITACDRCQEILATLEATDDLLLPSDRTADQAINNVVTMPAAHVEIPAEIVSASPSPALVAVPSRAARRAQSSWRSKTLRGANWKWLAPAGAIAAVLLLWVGFHETHPSTFELAKNTQPAPAPAAPTSTTSAGTPVPQSNELADHAKVEPSNAPRSQTNALAREETRKNDRVFLDEKKSSDRVASKPDVPQPATKAPAAPQGDRDSDLKVQSRNDSPDDGKESAAAVAPAPPSSVAEDGRAHAQKQNKDASELHSEVVVPSKSESVAKAKIAGGRQAPEQDQQRAAGNMLSLQTAETVTSDKNVPMMRVAKMSAANVISAPNNAALWRVSPAGIIERSTDKGATWEVQSSGVVSDLLTGSAPTSDVCWIVGRNGTILRTTDSGSHWQKLNAPSTDDLNSIFAVNAQQATVSTSTPQKSYRTTDAGKTWAQLPTP
jgi:hypothetical protein